jgi:hypothetical protein
MKEKGTLTSATLYFTCCDDRPFIVLAEIMSFISLYSPLTDSHFVTYLILMNSSCSPFGALADAAFGRYLMPNCNLLLTVIA